MPKPLIVSGCPILALYPLNGVVEAVPRTTLNHGGTGHQVWLPVRDGGGRSCHLNSGIMINSRGERRTKALERTEEHPTDSEQHQAEKPEDTDTVTTNHHMRLVEFRMWLWRIPGYGGWPLIKINSFHNNIWFDLCLLLSYCNIHFWKHLFNFIYIVL